MWHLEEVCEDVQEFVPKHDVRKQFHLLDVPPLSLALLGVASCEILPENGTVTQFERGDCVIVVHSCSKFLWMACNFNSNGRKEKWFATHHYQCMDFLHRVGELWRP
ncbi:MAG: hypothetical protein QOE33_3683, partial [Acidobacteriota bacterium]|nr:hypothetical protein [Acidobacteriota bacterium]